VIVLAGDIHAGTMHGIRSLPGGVGDRHRANPVLMQLTISALSHKPVDEPLWIDAVSKIDEELDIDLKPLQLLRILDLDVDWEALAVQATNVEEVFGEGSGAYILDSELDRRFLSQFSGLLMKRTVGFVRIRRQQAQRRVYRIELVLEGQDSSPLRSVIEVDFDAPSSPGLTLSATTIVFGSIAGSRTVRIENASRSHR
jgi:hypothetical protein